MHATGKAFQFTCAIPGIEVMQRDAIERQIAGKVGLHTYVAKGDTTLEEEKRLHIFTDQPALLHNLVGEVLAYNKIDIRACRTHTRLLNKPVVVLPSRPSADQEVVKHFFQAFDQACAIIVEVLQREPNPRKWVPKVRQRLKLLAVSRKLALAGQAAGLNIPPGDEMGLINMFDFCSANRQLFPNLFNTKYATPQWRSRLVRHR